MSLQITSSVSLAHHTTLGVGGEARYFVEVKNLSDLYEAVLFAENAGLPITILGGGSNMLVSDAGVAGLVIKMGMMGWFLVSESDESVLIEVAAGELLDNFVGATVAAGWWGLENLSGIPGTVGATPIQNVGAYGVEVADLIYLVRVYDSRTHETREMSGAQCGFGYRDSYFKTGGSHLIVCAVQFRLSRTPTPRLDYRDLRLRFPETSSPSLPDIRTAVIDIRSRKFPDWHHVGTAGSFFKNPVITRTQYERLLLAYPDMPHYATASDDLVKVPLGWILDRCLNVRGYREGAVALYENQSLVIVNYGGATAREIDLFAQKISDRVYSELSLVIEREVRSVS